jgi:hypothetical protein
MFMIPKLNILTVLIFLANKPTIQTKVKYWSDIVYRRLTVKSAFVKGHGLITQFF